MTYELDGRLMEITTGYTERARTSLHALVRVMQRCNLPEVKSLRAIKIAWQSGKSISELPMKRQRQYLARCMSLTDEGWTQLRVHNGVLFIFSAAGQLITAYPLPKSFYDNPRFDREKRRVRNVKNYDRMRPELSYVSCGI